MVNEAVGVELEKIGLYVINVNIRDIEDESGYIKAIGRKAAAEEPIYKKWWFWAGLIVVVGVAVGVPVGIYAGKSGAADPVDRGPALPPGFDPFTRR